jgi:hypothetical protein
MVTQRDARKRLPQPPCPNESWAEQVIRSAAQRFLPNSPDLHQVFLMATPPGATVADPNWLLAAELHLFVDMSSLTCGGLLPRGGQPC